MDRFTRIGFMKNTGMSFQDIGLVLGISRQRVFQILHRKLTGQNATRERVRERDNYICQKCGKKWEKGMRRFDVHHLNGSCGKLSRSYDKLNSLLNLITLCHKCHMNLEEVSKKREKGKLSALQYLISDIK